MTDAETAGRPAGSRDEALGPADLIIPTVADRRAGGGEVDLRSITALTFAGADAAGEVELFRATMRRLAGIELPAPVLTSAPQPGGIRIELDDDLRPTRPTQGRRADGAPPDREAYRLELAPTAVSIRARTPEGVHRALTSLVHLAVLGAGVVPGAVLDDAPGLAWRGLSLDVVRTFIPVEQVKRVFDLLSLYKLNVLHLHLTDNEGWRLQIDSWPRLTEIGARGARGQRPGGFYTQDDYRELVAYGHERHVTLVPEIDVPGHTKAALTAYPELGERGADSAFLDPGSDEVWRFVRDVVREVAALSPTPYLHIGGDEAFGMDDAAHAGFINRTVAIVEELGKRVVGWQEIARADVAPDEVVQHWIDFVPGADDEPFTPATMPLVPPEMLRYLADHFRKAAGDLDRAGAGQAAVLLSPTRHTYLDQPHGDPSTSPEQEARRATLGFPGYPPRPLEAMFDWAPLEAAPGPDRAALTGVEAALWCESVESIDDLELLLLPRLPGIAEVAWSPAPRAPWVEHRRRLAAHAALWEQAGWSWYRADCVPWAAP